MNYKIFPGAMFRLTGFRLSNQGEDIKEDEVEVKYLMRGQKDISVICIKKSRVPNLTTLLCHVCGLHEIKINNERVWFEGEFTKNGLFTILKYSAK